MKRWVFLFLGLFFVGFLAHADADDIDIYMAGNGEIPPNVLVIFDTSLSMSDVIEADPFDIAVTYPGPYSTDAVYYKKGSNWNNVFRDSINDIICPEALTALQTEGMFQGKISFFTTDCDAKTTYFLRTGNYMNYLASTSSGNRTKLGLAKGSIQSYVNSTYGIRFGAMVFNQDEGGHLLSEVQDMTPASRSDLHGEIGSLSSDTRSPLAETLYEAGLYFAGKSSYFNSGVTYTSPITDWCQKNYVIIISDGQPTMDLNPILETIGDTDNDGEDPGNYPDQGSDYLDDVAKYLFDSDLRPDLHDKQNLRIYTLGFDITHKLLEDTAKNGGGYYFVHNAQSFSIALQKVIQEILETSTSFVAPVVPISQMEKTTSGNKIYLALFKPTANAFWMGNIKKLGISDVDDPTAGIKKGDVIDSNGALATDDRGEILETSVSDWNTIEDGGETDIGGVGEVLLKRTTKRNLYSDLDPMYKPLTHPNNAFSKTNPRVAPSDFGVSTIAEMDNIFDFIYGYDVYDEDNDSNTLEKRRWILGAFLHSRPAVIHYDDTTTVLFAGSNDGIFHAFLDSDGSELWGFIPSEFIGKLKYLSEINFQYFVDGSPTSIVIDANDDGDIAKADGDRAILIFGERRGGRTYYALDVTTPTNPEILWVVDNNTVGFSELGQTWSTPSIGKLTNGQIVAVFGAGYDENRDFDVTPDLVGRGVFMVDVLTGSLVWKYTVVEDPNMDSSIPSDIATIDTNGNGYLDKLYVGDLSGKMWRFDIIGSDPQNWTEKVVFSGQRKIFYPPDVLLEKDHEVLIWGTGDRANPKRKDIFNRIYMVKDSNGSVLTENNLTDVTETEIQTAANGWYIRLEENLGEKVLSPPVTFFGSTYLTTFTPSGAAEFDPCYLNEGTARLYVLDYGTGSAVMDLDDDDGEDKLVRSRIIGTSIPSGLVVALIRGQASGFAGVSGGIFSPTLSATDPLIRMYWRQLF